MSDDDDGESVTTVAETYECVVCLDLPLEASLVPVDDHSFAYALFDLKTVTMVCGHTVHGKCASIWFATCDAAPPSVEGRNCPVCRAVTGPKRTRLGNQRSSLLGHTFWGAERPLISEHTMRTRILPLLPMSQEDLAQLVDARAEWARPQELVSNLNVPRPRGIPTSLHNTTPIVFDNAVLNRLIENITNILGGLEQQNRWRETHTAIYELRQQPTQHNLMQAIVCSDAFVRSYDRDGTSRRNAEALRAFFVCRMPSSARTGGLALMEAATHPVFMAHAGAHLSVNRTALLRLLDDAAVTSVSTQYTYWLHVRSAVVRVFNEPREGFIGDAISYVNSYLRTLGDPAARLNVEALRTYLIGLLPAAAAAAPPPAPNQFLPEPASMTAAIAECPSQWYLPEFEAAYAAALRGETSVMTLYAAANSILMHIMADHGGNIFTYPSLRGVRDHLRCSASFIWADLPPPDHTWTRRDIYSPPLDTWMPVFAVLLRLHTILTEAPPGARIVLIHLATDVLGVIQSRSTNREAHTVYFASTFIYLRSFLYERPARTSADTHINTLHQLFGIRNRPHRFFASMIALAGNPQPDKVNEAADNLLRFIMLSDHNPTSSGIIGAAATLISMHIS